MTPIPAVKKQGDFSVSTYQLEKTQTTSYGSKSGQEQKLNGFAYSKLRGDADYTTKIWGGGLQQLLVVLKIDKKTIEIRQKPSDLTGIPNLANNWYHIN